MIEREPRQIDRVFRALAHPVRRQILRRAARKACTITELAEPFDMSLEAVSKHIQVLERARLVRRTRHGRVHHCRMSPAPLQDAARVLAQLASHWEGRLDALERLLHDIESGGQ